MSMRVISEDETFPHVYFSVTNAGAVSTSFHPFPHDPFFHDDPIVLSPDKTLARRWRHRGLIIGFVNQALAPSYATHEFVPMVAPNGTQYVYTIDNTGSWTMQLFESGTPTNRILTTTLMHKGDLVWVADSRFPPPR